MSAAQVVTTDRLPRIWTQRQRADGTLHLFETDRHGALDRFALLPERDRLDHPLRAVAGAVVDPRTTVATAAADGPGVHPAWRPLLASGDLDGCVVLAPWEAPGETGVAFLAVRDAMVVGVLSLTATPAPRDGSMVIDVRPAYRRRGVGTALLLAALDTYPVDLARQVYSPEGLRLVCAVLAGLEAFPARDVVLAEAFASEPPCWPPDADCRPMALPVEGFPPVDLWLAAAEPGEPAGAT